MTTRVEVGGTVSNNKGLNLPGVAMSVPAMSDKDEADLRWALQLRADLIALSFVRSAADIDAVHKIMEEEGVRLPVIAKIEKPQAVDNLEEIVRAFDGIMVARGDLGVELPLEQVPLVQKYAVELARRGAKPVIVATQVLDSMITMPRPTRAEVSDCANAVLDGADARDAVRGDERRASTRSRPSARWPGSSRPPRTRGWSGSRRSAPARPPRAERSPTPRRRSGTCSTCRSSSPSPRAATRPGGCPGCARGSPCWRSPPTRRCARSSRSAGGSRRSSPSRVAHTDDMVKQVDEALLVDRAVLARRAGRHRGGLAARDPRVAQRDARAPDGRRRRGTGTGLQVAIQPATRDHATGPIMREHDRTGLHDHLSDVPGAGLEPACLSAAHFECAVSADSTNPARARTRARSRISPVPAGRRRPPSGRHAPCARPAH